MPKTKVTSVALKNSRKTKKIKCRFCGKTKPMVALISTDIIHPPILDVMRGKVSAWDGKGYVCRSDYQQIKNDYVRDVVKEDKGELTRLEKEVLRSLKQHDFLSKNINRQFDKDLTVGERVADHVAEFGGSWFFILTFISILILWILANAFFLAKNPFDPYPFILLNLVLSCLAALQAPIIMMSQNRQAAKDRLQSEHDYKINLKAELEIRHLNEKMDHLLSYQWQRLLEIQQLQVEMMEDLQKKPGRKVNSKMV